MMGAVFAAWNGPRHLMGYGLSLLLGFILYLAHFPLPACIAVATVLYVIHPERAYRKDKSPYWLGIIVLGLSAFSLVWPPSQKSPELLLKAGEPWPRELRPETPFIRDAYGRNMVLFLRADCDECRDWMPLALQMNRRVDLPPLAGIAPQPPSDVETYRRREEIPFPIRSVEAKAFDRAVRRTPLLVADGPRVLRLVEQVDERHLRMRAQKVDRRLDGVATAVVDHRGTVHGIEGLSVIDASIMPTIPAANTNLPTIMIAERCATWVTDGRRQEVGL